MASITADNAAFLFLDLQDHTIGSEKTQGRHRLRRAAGSLAKLAALHGLPGIVSSIPPGGAYLKSVLEALDQPPLHPRTVTTAFGDPSFVDAVAASGRKTLVLAGVAAEIVVLRTALDALDAGYDVQIAIDACGGFSERTEAAAWNRATARGAVMTSVVTIAAELAGDFTSELGAKTMALMYEAVGK